MSDGVPSDYCPPADPSDYLESGVQYPGPRGKEWQESTNPDENDLSDGAEKQNKNPDGSLNLTGSSSGIAINKISNRVRTGIEAKSVKSTSSLNLGVASNKNGSRINFAGTATRKGSLPI
jgi:hypothetical protein